MRFCHVNPSTSRLTVPITLLLRTVHYAKLVAAGKSFIQSPMSLRKRLAAALPVGAEAPHAHGLTFGPDQSAIHFCPGGPRSPHLCPVSHHGVMVTPVPLLVTLLGPPAERRAARDVTRSPPLCSYFYFISRLQWENTRANPCQQARRGKCTGTVGQPQRPRARLCLSYRHAVAGPMDTLVLARIVVDGPSTSDD